MECREPLVDIHCHLIAGIDDGAKSWNESLAMARMAVADGIDTIIVTPHQLGNYSRNSGCVVRERTDELQRLLAENDVPLRVLPGADVRIEADMIDGLRSGNVLTLGDHRKHVLLELPHELYFPIEPVLDRLHSLQMVGILSHPERNQGLIQQSNLIAPLVANGCLMQVTAGSFMGAFGKASQRLAEQMLRESLVHFVATDAHGVKSRRPLLRRAMERVAEIAGEQTAIELCCQNPAAVAAGMDVKPTSHRSKAGGRSRWFRRKRSA